MKSSWKVGLRVVAPGVYADGKGAMHVDAEEVCLANGYAPTKENQAMLERVVHEAFDGVDGVDGVVVVEVKE